MKKALSENEELIYKSILEFLRTQNESNYCDYSRLTLFDKIFIGALLSEGLDLTRTYIRPLNMLSGPLMPNIELMISTLWQLTQEKILISSKESSDTRNYPSFNIQIPNIYSRGTVHHNPFESSFLSTPLYLNCHPKDTRRVIDELINPTNLNLFSKHELYYHWQMLVAWECVEYLEHKTLELFGVANLDKNEMFEVMNQLLTELSQSKIFKIIESSVFSAQSYANQKGISTERGAKNVLTTFQIFADNAINKEGWYKKGFQERPRDAPQCLVLKFLLKKVLNREDNGFDVVFSPE